MTFEDSLEAAGFFRDGSQWTHTEHGITVIEGAGKDGLPYVMANGVADKDMEAWLDSWNFQTGYLDFGGRLCAWVSDNIFMSSNKAEPKLNCRDPDDAHDGEEYDDDDKGSDDDWDHYEPLKHYLDRLPNVAQIQDALKQAKIDINFEEARHRDLLIYTWGDKKNMSKAGVSQKYRKPKLHINAKPLNGRGGSCRKNAVEDERIVKRVASSMQKDDAKWLVDRVEEIEKYGGNCFSIFCSKGRHRSVSAAIILKKVLYPNAKLKHLTIS